MESLDRGFVVKRITKKLKSDGSIRTYYYVYEQYRDGKKVVTKYIDSLEEIVEFYVENRLNREKWARGDLNPRPPGYEPGALPG